MGNKRRIGNQDRSEKTRRKTGYTPTDGKTDETIQATVTRMKST